MKQIFRRGGIILSVLVLALIFSSCSPLAIRSQSSKISLTLPSASDVRRAFGPEVITSYMVGINSDSTGERCYDEVVDAGEHLEAEVPAGDYTVIIIGMEGLESNPGSYMLSGLAKQSGIKVLPNETTEVALKMVPLEINTSNIPHRVEGKNPWTGAQLPVISNEGYTFDGWYANNDLSAFLTQFPDTENLTEVTITAKWTAKITPSGGHVDNEGHYAIVAKGVSNDLTPHTGEWGDPIPINQLDFSTLPQNTAFFLMEDLGTDATPYFLEALRKSVLFDGQVDGVNHSITLGSVASTIQIDGNYAIRNLTINGNGANTVPLFTVNSDGLLYFYNCEVFDVQNIATGSKGGVVYNNGTLRIQNTTMTGCSASLGGTAYCTETSKLNVQGSSFDCSAGEHGNNLYLEANAAICKVDDNFNVTEVVPLCEACNAWMDSRIDSSWMTYDYQKPEWKQGWVYEDDSASDIYKVTSKDDFLALREWISSHNTAATYIKLEADITIPGGNWTSANGRLTSSGDFLGTFDGQGHTITFEGSNVTPLCHDLGSSGVIKNLGIKGDITGNWGMVSPFCLANNGTIAGCYFEGTVSGGTNNYAFGGGTSGKIFGCIAVSNSSGLSLSGTSQNQGSSLVTSVSSITDETISTANEGITAWNSQSSDNGCYYKLTLSEGVVGFTKIN